MCWQKNWIGSKKFQVFVKRTKSDRACRKIHLYALFFYVFSRKKSKSRKKGEKSEDKDKIALQIKQVKKGLNKRERSRAKRLQTIRKSVCSHMIMAFFSSAINILQTLVVAIGAGLGVWGVINLMEGYGNDNPGAKSQGIKHLMSSM